MPRAIWNGAVIAESSDTVKVEGNHYFPPDSVKREYSVESETHTVCPWKGVASHYTLEVNGKRNVDAAWFYPRPERAAEKVRGRVAFWRGVQVVPSEQERAARSGRGFLSRLLRAA
ncbi:MAG TPA: DUF427 domain-containing protein [Gaiellaceae bacterium]|jgi:uncharacterized protein (DUF427 family)